MKYKLLRFSLLSMLVMFFGGLAHADYQKVTSASDITDGEYLIVYEAGNVAFNGALETLDAVSNVVAAEIADGKIASSSDLDKATFTIATTDNGYTVKSASGLYIGITSYGNGLKSSAEVADGYYNSISFDENGNLLLVVTTSGGDMTMKFNAAFKDSSDRRIQKLIQLTPQLEYQSQMIGQILIHIASLCSQR